MFITEVDDAYGNTQTDSPHLQQAIHPDTVRRTNTPHLMAAAVNAFISMSVMNAALLPGFQKETFKMALNGKPGHFGYFSDNYGDVNNSKQTYDMLAMPTESCL